MDDLPRLYPFLFGGLSPEEIADRIAYYGRRASEDVVTTIDRLVEDQRPPEAAGEVALPIILRLVLPALRAECEARGRGVVADSIEEKVRQVLDSAQQGETRGEQRAALGFRHPRSNSPLTGIAHEPSGPTPKAPDARTLKQFLVDPLYAIRVDREISTLQDELRQLIPAKSKRQDRKGELYSVLRSRYPELQRTLKTPADVADLTPGQAARIVWGARRDPPVSASTVDDILIAAKDVVKFHTDRRAFLKKYPITSAGW